MIETVVLMLALMLDGLLGEPRRFHPLVGFGLLTQALEKTVNRFKNQPNSRIAGIVCWLLLALPLPVVYFIIHQESALFWCIDVIVVYAAIGHKSLKQHALQILKPLQNNDIDEARHFCSYIVSRDTKALSEVEIVRATTESVLENGHDAVIATLVWYMIGGAPLVILHRLANTLDAMWGYKNTRFIHFGWCAAKMDDLLGWPTAKITCLLFALQKRFYRSLKNGWIQGRQYKSLNGGWVMAAGATVLNFKLGGKAIYHGKIVESVTLGAGEPVVVDYIARSLNFGTFAALIFITAAKVTKFRLRA
ncbi:MAG: cobalamin biosynthesis protein CobD, partial [Algicola sp.]|nr:cobalamin biosynthesis protein CobD [Algicola sp.]